jgi:hypothetical protein
MVNRFPIYREAALAISHHDPYPCGSTDFATEVGLPTLAELAFFALCLVARNDMIPRLHVGYPFTNAFNNSISINKSEVI